MTSINLEALKLTLRLDDWHPVSIKYICEAILEREGREREEEKATLAKEASQ